MLVGGVEAGEVVFEEVDDAALLVEGRHWELEAWNRGISIDATVVPALRVSRRSSRSKARRPHAIHRASIPAPRDNRLHVLIECGLERHLSHWELALQNA